jgi:DNA-binding transcriptional MerR regulator
VKPHVLRYWEQEFPQLKPVKRRGNRRYYQHDDVQMVRRIRSLLYEQGFTIGGARQRLRELRNEVVNAAEDVASKALSPSERKRKALRDIRVELEGLLDRWPL